MIIAPDKFRDEEFLEPKKVFEDNNLKVTVASKGVKQAKGKLGAIAEVDKDISEINTKDYDAIAFIGGAGASVYFEDDTALSLAKEAYDQGKITAAICIAPSILANAGILNGKKATAFQSEENNLVEKGADYTGQPVTQDGNIITANGPAAATSFGVTIAKALANQG